MKERIINIVRNVYDLDRTDIGNWVKIKEGGLGKLYLKEEVEDTKVLSILLNKQHDTNVKPHFMVGIILTETDRGVSMNQYLFTPIDYRLMTKVEYPKGSKENTKLIKHLI